MVGLGPGKSDFVFSSIVRVISLSEERNRPGPSNIYLLLIRSWEDEDGLGGVIIREGKNGVLHSGEMGGGVSLGDKNCSFRTAEGRLTGISRSLESACRCQKGTEQE